MTGTEAIALARRRGVTLEVFLGKLRAYSESEADEMLVRLLRANKQAVVDAILAAEMESDRWRRVLAEKIETVMTIRGLPRPDAGREAFQHFLIEFLNWTHPNTDPTCCTHGGGPETRGDFLLPFGMLAHRYTWLHGNRCWAAWREARRKAPVEALAAVGVAPPGRR